MVNGLPSRPRRAVVRGFPRRSLDDSATSGPTAAWCAGNVRPAVSISIRRPIRRSCPLRGPVFAEDGARHRVAWIEPWPGSAPGRPVHDVEIGDGDRTVPVTALHVDPRRRLWVGTRGAGLYRSDDPAAERPGFTVYAVADGLSSGTVWCLTSDARWQRLRRHHARCRSARAREWAVQALLGRRRSGWKRSDYRVPRSRRRAVVRHAHEESRVSPHPLRPLTDHPPCGLADCEFAACPSHSSFWDSRTSPSARSRHIRIRSRSTTLAFLPRPGSS